MAQVILEVEPGAPLPPAPGRSCGSCTACCTTLPVKEIDVGAWQRCPKLHEAFSAKCGCSIYDNRPFSCRQWSCSWLIGDGLDDSYRPDRLGLVLDPLPDVVRIAGQIDMPAAQIWVIPGHEEDFRLPKVWALICEMTENGFWVLWRMKKPDGNGQLARMFGRMPDGRIGMTDVQDSSEHLSGLENEGERFIHAQRLLQGE